MIKMTNKTISPLDSRYFEDTKPVRDFFSEENFYFQRIKVEIMYLKYFCLHSGLTTPFSTSETKVLDKLLEGFSDNEFKKIKAIEKKTKHDIKAIEYFLGNYFENNFLGKRKNLIHFGLTSEDVNNLSYGIILTSFIRQIYLKELEEIIKTLLRLSLESKSFVMPARTHGQLAVPTTFGKEIGVYVERLEEKKQEISQIKLAGKLNGAVGNYNAFQFIDPKKDWLSFSRTFVEKLGLLWCPLTTQILPGDSFTELFFKVKQVNSILIGLVQDLWIYNSYGYLILKNSNQEVGSSTMPQKINPVDFENAEGNFGLANSLMSFFIDKLLISRMQRDLSDSTVKRNFGAAFGYTILAFHSLKNGLLKISFNQRQAVFDLDQNWSILSEAIQIALRLQNGKNDYETIKKYTRGKIFSQKDYLNLLERLEIDKKYLKKLKELTPEKYFGLADKLVDLLRR